MGIDGRTDGTKAGGNQSGVTCFDRMREAVLHVSILHLIRYLYNVHFSIGAEGFPSSELFQRTDAERHQRLYIYPF
jgi:hypothetical protein